MIKPGAVFNVCVEFARVCEKDLTADDVSAAMGIIHEIDDSRAGQCIRTVLLDRWRMSETDVERIRRARNAVKEKKQYLASMAEQFDEMILKGLAKPKDRDAFIESLKENRIIEL